MTSPTTPRLNRVVVGIDFSEASSWAATWIARHFAREVQLVFVHVLEGPPMPGFLAKRYPSTDQILEAARAGAEKRLRTLIDAVATTLVWPEVRVGRTDEEVTRVAAEYDADLIAVGRADLHPNAWGRVGTTAQRILRRSHLPVLLVPGGPPDSASQTPAHFLVAVDDSDMTTPVLSWGGFLADRFAVEATVLHVLNAPIFPGASALPGTLLHPDAPPSATIPDFDREAAAEASRWLEDRVRSSTSAASMTPRIISGASRPAEAIIEEARQRESPMIVIGSRGSGIADRFFFGSVAEAVLRDAPCPVLVVVPASRTRPSPDRAAVARNPVTAPTRPE